MAKLIRKKNSNVQRAIIQDRPARAGIGRTRSQVILARIFQGLVLRIEDAAFRDPSQGVTERRWVLLMTEVIKPD